MNWQKIKLKLEARGYSSKEIDEKIMPALKKIDRLRKEKNAIILAHFYQHPAIQMIADEVGDSFTLAKLAKELKDVNLVVSCTVEFMAEMIKILSPEKKVVIPSTGASCSIAEGMNSETVMRIKKAFPNGRVVGYINAQARTMASFDSVCTSANASDVVKNIEGNPVIIVPDYYLALNIINRLDDDGRTYLAYERTIGNHAILHDVRKNKRMAVELERPPDNSKGTCIVHERFSKKEIEQYRKRHNVDLVLGHPEVKPEVAEASDFVGSTGKMITHVQETNAKNILVLSECNLVSPLLEAYPDRTFVTPCKLCPYMGRNTLEGVISALENETYEVVVPEDVMTNARQSLSRMFELSQVKKCTT